MKKIWINIFKGVILLLALLYVLSKVDIFEVVEILTKVNLKLYIVAFLIFVFVIFLSSIKWYEILKAFKIKIDFKNAVKLYYKGYLFNLFFPSAVGGDIAKTYWLKKHQNENKISYSFLSSFYDRFSGLIALIILFLMAYSLFNDNVFKNALYIIIALSLIIIFFILLRKIIFGIFYKIFKKGKINSIFKEIEKSINIVLNDKKLLFKILLIAIFSQSIGIFGQYILLSSLDVQISLYFTYILLTLVRILNALPISFGGIGTKEAFLVFIAGYNQIPSDDILAYSLLVYTFPLLLFILMGWLIVKR